VTQEDDASAVFDLLIDLHSPHERQGPGSIASTLHAIDRAGLTRDRRSRIADLGCGTGSSALLLAETLDTEVLAVDLFEPFLEELHRRASSRGVADRITTLQASIDSLPFHDEEFDVIWSEGAIYNIGFATGVQMWRRFLRPGGVLVISEITWLTAARPAVLEEYWLSEYPEIDTASAKIQALERSGYSPIGYFTLPADCWREGYYEAILSDLDAFCARNDSPLADQIADAERAEAQVYDTFSDYYSYGMYVARRVD
jgi:SAM-dependent methyltransferase